MNTSIKTNDHPYRRARSLRPLALLSLVSWACGGTRGADGASAHQSIHKQPLSSSIAKLGADSPEVFVGSRWRPLQAGIKGVKEIKAGPRGSIVSIGKATLWMRSGSRVAVFEDQKGQPILEVQEGQLRYRTLGEPGHLIVGDKVQQASTTDLLLSRHFDKTRFVATDENPDAGLWSLELEVPARAQGVGSMDVRPIDEDQPSKDDWRLQLRSLKVTTQIDGNMAATEVEHIFYNDADVAMEGTFRFPAPDDVMVTGLAMEIDGKLMEGEFVERTHARQVYEKIVDEMQDPALLEWEQGGWFKLRVFPISAKGEKRVILRYAAPLQVGVEGFEYRYLATPPEGEVVEKFSLSVNGSIVEEVENLGEAHDVVVGFPGKMIPAQAHEVRGDYEYLVGRIAPDFHLGSDVSFSAQSRNIVIAMDSSRSALENREISAQVLDMLISEMRPNDRFALFSFDIAQRGPASEFLAPTEEHRKKALASVAALDYDGASDLHALFQRAAELGKGRTNLQVVYIGDGTPTWGTTDTEELVDAARSLGAASLHAAIVGRGASATLWKELTGSQGGLLVRPHTEIEARKFAFSLARKMSLPKMQDLQLLAGEGVEIFPRNRQTVFVGDALDVVVRAPKGKLPSTLVLAAMRGGKRVEDQMPLAFETISSDLLAKRWAQKEIARMERDSADKEAIVEMSREFGVLSKHTSLLVLESEEAYKQHQIERKKREQEQQLASVPNVTGGDLDNLDGRQASLSPDNIQPGDPEVRIPAPADARSVVLIFPFGETKIAYYDAETQEWVARFLITPETADGQYWVRVNIEHKDGHVEHMRLPYVVDTRAPMVRVRAFQIPNGRIQIQVQQESEAGSATVLSESEFDASRVEVTFPWGQTARVYRKEPGFFRGNIRMQGTPAQTKVGEELSLVVVVTDEALNQRALTLNVTVERMQ